MTARKSRAVQNGEHTYLWENIPRALWDQASAQAGGVPMKRVLVRLLEKWVRKGPKKPATIPVAATSQRSGF